MHSPKYTSVLPETRTHSYMKYLLIEWLWCPYMKRDLDILAAIINTAIDIAVTCGVNYLRFLHMYIYDWC